MSTKTIKSRIQIKSDTSANWDTASRNGFTPLEGEFIYYNDGAKGFKLKIGDGIHTPNDLDFIDENVIADWNQNDENAPGFIQNRTHYVEIVETLEFYNIDWPEELSANPDWDKITTTTPSGRCYFIPGKYFIYNENVAGPYLEKEVTLTTASNSLEDLVYIDSEAKEDDAVYHRIYYRGEGKFTLVYEQEIVHKLDPKFLPSSADWNENDSTAGAYISNRTHYVESERVELEFGPYQSFESEPVQNYGLNQVLVWTDEGYKFIPGTYYVYEDYLDGPEKSIITLTEPSSSIAAVWIDNSGALCYTDPPVLFAIRYIKEEIVHKLDPKFLPKINKLGGVASKKNTTGARAVPLVNNNEDQIYSYKKYDSETSVNTLVERNSSGLFNIEKASGNKHPVRYDQAKDEFAAKNSAPQTVYITDPQGEQSHKKYTSEAEPASIVHREQSLNTFMVADPLYNGHPVTARYAKEKFFPIQNTDQTKYIRNISTYNEDESPLTNSQIDACIAAKCELGQKIYSPEVVSYHPLNQQTVATIVADENGNKIVNSYITVGTEEESVIVPRSPYLCIYGDDWVFRTPDGVWYWVDRHDVDDPGLDPTVIPSTAIPYNNKEFSLEVCDLADSFEHVTSAVMIQDPSGNPSYKNYTTGVADQANYIDYNYNLTDVDKYNRIEREKVGGQIVSFNSQGFFNVPNPENACHPVNLGYAQANFLRLKTKKENGEVANVYTDSIPYIKVQDQDYGISLNNAVFEPLKLTYGPSHASDTSQSGRVLRYYSNGRFNVLDPTASLHPVNKQYLESQLSSYVKKGAEGYTFTTGYNNTGGDDIIWLTLNNSGFKVEAENSATDYNKTYIQLNRNGITLYSDYHSDPSTILNTSQITLVQDGVLMKGSKLTFNGKRVLTESDFSGITGAMHFIGVYSVHPEVAFAGSDKERALEAGDVYINNNTQAEYVYDGFIWVELGSEGSYVLKTEYDEVVANYEQRIAALEAAIAALPTYTALNIVDNNDVLEIQ